MKAAGQNHYRILIIDDDADLNALLTEYLARFGHQLRSATSAARGLQELRRELPDLVILDIMLPDVDGLTLCREISGEFDVPIVMLTARGEVADRVLGLELGADDYLAKPFEPRELVARIQSVIRRSSNRTVATEALEFDGLRIDIDTRRVSLDGTLLELTTMEFDVLAMLARDAGHVVRREDLCTQVIGVEYDGIDRGLDVHVSRIRRKLQRSGFDPSQLKSVRAVGYLLAHR